MTEIEEDANSILGATIMQFGFEHGRIVLVLSDGRQLTFGADDDRIWFHLQEYTLQ